MIIDLRQEIRESKDSTVLNAILSSLIGVPCLKVEINYGDELAAHLGSPVPCRHPKLQDEFAGSWILGSRASKWTFSVGNPPYIASSEKLSSDALLDVEKQARQFTGSTVIDTCSGITPVLGQSEPEYSLVVRFSNGATISLTATEDPDATGLSDWELFTPYGMYLTCGPGRIWSYLPSGSGTNSNSSASSTAMST